MAKPAQYWVNVPVVKVVPDREPYIQAVRVEKRKIVLIYRERKWHAIQQRCPHEGGPLEAGRINEEGKIVCPWHRYAFDIESGQCEKGGFFLDTYATRVEGQHLQVCFERKKWGLW
ncbi:MAG: Rieske 2Fe-2S domain-containing protein [Bacteroidota bacterium]